MKTQIAKFVLLFLSSSSIHVPNTLDPRILLMVTHEVQTHVAHHTKPQIYYISSNPRVLIASRPPLVATSQSTNCVSSHPLYPLPTIS